MFNLYIADDEKQVIEILSSIIHWEQYNIRIVGTSTSGKQAYEDIMSNDIDIVITDIRMPGMNGLELIKKVKELKKDIIFIVCSGYSDFNYAKEAMRHGTLYYLIKPVDIDDIVEAVQIATNKCNEFKSLTGEQVSKFKEEKMFLDSLLYGQYYPETDFDHFFVASAQLEDLPDFKNALDKIICESIDSDNCKFKYIFNQNEIIIIFIGFIKHDTIIQALHGISQQIQEKLNLEVYWGVGSSKPNVPNIHSSYTQSKQAFNYALYINKKIANIQEVHYSNDRKIDVNYQAIMGGLTGQDDHKRAEEYIHSFIRESLNNRVSPDVLIYHCTEIINYATNYFGQLYSIPPEDLYQHNYASIKLLNEVKSAYKMEKVTLDCLNNMIMLINERMKDYKDKVITQIKEYIHKNSNKSICAADIAKIVNFNPSYISSFFKKKTGMTLSDYITEIKMEKAKQLLANSVLKVNQVAEEVGYDDQRYFCLVFKKYSGTTPTKFRDRK